MRATSAGPAARKAGKADDPFLAKLEKAEATGGAKKAGGGAKKKKKPKAPTAGEVDAAAPLLPKGVDASQLRAEADAQWARAWANVQLTNLPRDTSFGVGELVDREPRLATTLSELLRPHFHALMDCYHKYADVVLPSANKSVYTDPNFVLSAAACAANACGDAAGGGGGGGASAGGDADGVGGGANGGGAARRATTAAAPT